MIDAAGAIYVIGGGIDGNTFFNDTWVSSDGGARPDLVTGISGGYARWAHQVGTHG